MSGHTEKQKALDGIRAVAVQLLLPDVPAERQEYWIARFAGIKGIPEREAAAAEARAEMRAVPIVAEMQPETRELNARFLVEHFIAESYRRMQASGDLADAIGKSASYILDTVLPAPMTERAIADILAAGPGGMEALQAAAARVRERFDGYLSQVGATDKARMPPDHWPRLLNALVGEVLTRATARVPPGGGGGGRRVAA